jgi:hypothetical protein
MHRVSLAEVDEEEVPLFTERLTDGHTQPDLRAGTIWKIERSADASQTRSLSVSILHNASW